MRTIGPVVVALLSVVASERTSRAQSAAYGGYGWSPAYAGMSWSPAYGGFGWGRQFGVAGGPIVTTNGYLYPVYSPNGSGLSGFVNATPVFNDWSSGYALYDPARRSAIASLGYGPEAGWGWRTPLLPRVAAPASAAIVAAGGSPPAPAAGGSQSGGGPQILDLGPKPGAPSPADRTAAKPVILRGGADEAPNRPHILEIGRPPSTP